MIDELASDPYNQKNLGRKIVSSLHVVGAMFVSINLTFVYLIVVEHKSLKKQNNSVNGSKTIFGNISRKAMDNNFYINK